VPLDGAILLGELVGRIDRLETRCRHCDRYGRVRLTKLIADHGADAGLPDLALRLARGWPRQTCSIWPSDALSIFRSWWSCSGAANPR
jgi:hypothetical protein